MSKRTFNDIADQIRGQITDIAADAKLSVDTVVNVLRGRFTGATAHGEPCMDTITRAAGGSDRVATLSRHIGGYDF